jgi:hypothetical protein
LGVVVGSRWEYMGEGHEESKGAKDAKVLMNMGEDMGKVSAI